LAEISEEPASEAAVREIEEPTLDGSPPTPSPSSSTQSFVSQPRIRDAVRKILSPEALPLAESIADRQIVVFTIQFPNELSNKPLQVMTTIADNTRTAIINAVNSYLDSKSILKGTQGQREIDIKYGVGRNGDVDLSTLDETMWPDYLDYFRQYTRIPELTVDVVEVVAIDFVDC